MRPKIMNKKPIGFRWELLGQSVLRLIKGVWRLPRSFGLIMKEKRRQTVLDALEAERLDRIRHPSDYLGK
jgi:hypothetical protein